MLTPIRVLWSVLTVSVTVTCCITFLQPYWFFHKSHRYTLGLFAFCALRDRRAICRAYSTDVAVYDMATGVWQSASLIFGGGCILMCAGSLLVVLSLFREGEKVKLSVAATYAQVVAVIMWTVALIVQPLSLSAAFVRHFCGHTSAYVTDECQMGWSYMLAIMGTALSFFCPVLAFFKDFGTSPPIPYYVKSRLYSAGPIIKRPLSAVSHYDKIVSKCHTQY